MRNRVLTAAVLAPPVVAAAFLRPVWPLFALCAAAFVLCCAEYRSLMGRPSYAPPILGSASLLAFGISWRFQDRWPPVGVFAGLAILAAIGAALTRLDKPGPAKIDPTEAAGLWIACPLAALCRLHGSDGAWTFAPNLVLMAIVPVWAGDIAGIFVGKAFGKRLLAPRLSPKKTIEGSIAILVACVAAAWGLGLWLGLPQAVGIGVGVALGFLGQCGDLFQSSIKRRCGVKDSGTVLPGHGGVLDRIDSLLFAAPAACIILALATASTQ